MGANRLTAPAGCLADLVELLAMSFEASLSAMIGKDTHHFIQWHGSVGERDSSEDQADRVVSDITESVGGSGDGRWIAGEREHIRHSCILLVVVSSNLLHRWRRSLLAVILRLCMPRYRSRHFPAEPIYPLLLLLQSSIAAKKTGPLR